LVSSDAIVRLPFFENIRQIYSYFLSFPPFSKRLQVYEGQGHGISKISNIVPQFSQAEGSQLY
jgi:hypothetical protein